MERVKNLHLITVALTLLALVAKMESQIRPPAVTPMTPRPLCASQFALANYACAKLPFTPGSPPEPPPSPPSPPDEGHHSGHHSHSHSHSQRHGRHNHNHRQHRRHQGPEEEECCRWAKEVDSQCVCELLVRLPPFLMRPLHQYSLLIGEDCHFTYSCGAPI